MAHTFRALIHRGVMQEEVLFRLFADTLAEQRLWIGSLLRTTLLNLPGHTEEEVRCALAQLEEEGLL